MTLPIYTVAVLGAGPQGLAALKNLLEENQLSSSSGSEAALFAPTIFEARDRVGGLWAYCDDPGTPTVLESTLGNVCRWRNCYSDFPVEDGDLDRADEGVVGEVYQGQKGFLRYLERYVETFGLARYIRFNARVGELRRVEGDREKGKWEVSVRDEKVGGGVERRLFDKVIIAIGQYMIPQVPEIEGMEKFSGTVIHSKSYKRASDLDGKDVLLVGFGNTAADIAVDLVDHAQRIFLSHRHGNYIFPRITNGKPIDMFSTRRAKDILSIVKGIAPARSEALMSTVVESLSDRAVTLKPEWNFKPVQPLILSPPIISDTLLPELAGGSITSICGVRRILDRDTIELQDSTTVKVDSIIFCTGYKANHSISLAPSIDFESPESTSHAPIPRLYQNIFAPAHADSLAFLNNWIVLPAGICEFADLITMAIAQVWKGAFQLPSEQDMNREIDRKRAWCDAITGQKGILPKLVDEGRFRTWLHEAAGTGVNEKLGWGLEGWLFWARDRKFCNVLMSGVESPHLARLFDGRRKKWDGARDAIFQANKDIERIFGSQMTRKKKS